MKQKVKAIASSIATIAMCASLAVGGTFALFTSEDEVNIAVTSGTVNVVASVNAESLKTYSMDKAQESGKFENGGTAAFNADSQLELSLMTPGDKAEFTVDIANNSNVAIQYKVTFGVSGELADALVCSATNAEEKWIYAEAGKAIDSVDVSVEIPETVGDDYQSKGNTTVSVKVEAVQGNAYIGPDAIITRYEEDALPVRTPISGNMGGITFPKAPEEIAVEAAWTFKATDNDETVQTSPYKDWICDFVIESNGDVALGELGLWGAYGGMDFAFANPIALPEGQSLFMLTSVGMPFTYADICTGVVQFDCGVFRGLAGEQMKDKTITVSLCLINPEYAEKLIEDVSKESPDLSNEELLLEVMKKSRWEGAIGTDVLIANKTAYTFE